MPSSIHQSTTPTLFHGSSAGNTYGYLHADRMLTRRLRARGLKGARHGKKITFASTSSAQAREYAFSENHLYVAVPHPGSIITWATGIKDMVVCFETFLQERWRRSEYFFQGVDQYDLLSDTRGCLDTIGCYLSNRRQEAAVSRMIDTFFEECDIHEFIYQSARDLARLDGHQGEVSISGGCTLERCEQLPVAA